ncbi:hypothetical protein [Streptomyces kaempferi]|uniref:YD repeat-containing protein n=1 Tax=Streptomyces kaempferi TaxID=333725 RepID=A0ABW3XGL0_9ACTN
MRSPRGPPDRALSLTTLHRAIRRDLDSGERAGLAAGERAARKHDVFLARPRGWRNQVWTAKTTCPAQGTDPTTATVASTAGSYWQTYGYDAIGDRSQVVDHSTSGGADSTTTYANGCTTGCNATGAQPHTLTATTGGTSPTTFVYDTAGNLLTRTLPAARASASTGTTRAS